MMIEDEILLLLLPLIQKLVFSDLDRKEFPYTRTQMLILVALKRRGPLFMRQIADFISASKEQATRSVAPLSDQGLVERYIDPGNRKLVYIRLTDAGVDFMNRLTEQVQEKLREQACGKLSEEELEQLCHAIQTTYELLGKL